MLQTRPLTALLGTALAKQSSISTILLFTARGSVLATSSPSNITDSRIYATSLSQIFAAYSTQLPSTSVEHIVLEFNGRTVVLWLLQRRNGGLLLAVVSQSLTSGNLNNQEVETEAEESTSLVRQEARINAFTTVAIEMSEWIKLEMKKFTTSAKDFRTNGTAA
ncbi:MAG: hypothetical protein M1814_003938 [Vezdaea aestivalis]|nr:MAG: hypothetical protein M1814_003938 [Vezdaea aestivalis]